MMVVAILEPVRISGNRESDNFESARFLQFKSEIQNLKSEDLWDEFRRVCPI
jgi:hypothetical protein